MDDVGGSCPKCLTGGTGYVIGKPCITRGCDGTVRRSPTLRDVTTALAEPMTCGRRMQDFGPWEQKEGLDRWLKHESNGDRVCNFCGSLHFDDFTALVKQSAEAPEDALSAVQIEPSDKKYKVYVSRPGVRNSTEGGIKFYMHHVPRGADGKITATEEQQQQFAEAVRRSDARFAARMRAARKYEG